MEDESGIRLSKLLALRGVSSRRGAEELIATGVVTINGKVTKEPGIHVDPDQQTIKVNGRNLPKEPERVYYVMYKPRGVLTAKDPEGRRKSLADDLTDLGVRVEPVGRLDFNTEGAVILTNDGELAAKLTKSSSYVPKRYVVKVYRTPDTSDIRAIERGVVMTEGRSRPAKARVIDTTGTENAWMEITITEGGHRVIQRMMTQLGHPVSKLRRESFGTINIRNMERGQVRRLTVQEVSRLRDIADGIKPKKAGKTQRKEGFAKPKPKKRRVKKSKFLKTRRKRS